MSSGGIRTTHYQNTQMTIKSTEQQLPTTPAITYSECYRLPFINLIINNLKIIIQ